MENGKYSFTDIIAIYESICNAREAASAELLAMRNSIPLDSIGMTNPAIKNSAEWQNLQSRFKVEFDGAKRLIKFIQKNYKAELRSYQKAKYGR